MTRRVLGGAAVALMLALAAVGFLPQAAQAAQAPALTVSSPSAGMTATQPVTVVGQASMNGGRVDFVRITVESTQNFPVPGANTQNGPGNNTPLQFSWTPPIAYNGQYKITVAAQGTETPLDFNGPEATAVVRTVSVEVPPAPPANVKAVANQTKRTVALTWNPNSEQDITGYGVFRKQGDKFVQRAILTPDKTTYVDDIGSLPQGTYSYQVFAARPNAAGNSFVASAPSSTVSAKVTTSPAPPSTTTAPTTSGSGSVSGKGNTVTTTPGTKPTTLATHGKTDLSGFASLLPTGGAKLPNVKSTPAPDPGFEGDLPFDGENGETSVEGNSQTAQDDGQALGGTLASSNDEEPTSLRFMAAGLLVTVVLMHLLWLRDEVNREPLPAVAVDEPELEPDES